MAAQRKRVCTNSSQALAKNIKRQVGVSTFEKWQREFEREYQSLLWLRCDKDEVNRSLVATLYCEVCQPSKDRIQGIRNFSPAWLTGSTNHRTSNVLDHAKSEQHVASTARLQEERVKAQDMPTSSYAPIARSLVVLDDLEKERVKRKFEICFISQLFCNTFTCTASAMNNVISLFYVGRCFQQKSLVRRA